MKPVTLSSKNQVVIPSAVRKKLGLKGGDKLIVARITDNSVVLKKEPSIHDLIGTVPSQTTKPEERVRAVREQWRNP